MSRVPRGGGRRPRSWLDRLLDRWWPSSRPGRRPAPRPAGRRGEAPRGRAEAPPGGTPPRRGGAGAPREPAEPPRAAPAGAGPKRRAAAALLAVLEVVALVALLLSPPFQVRDIAVSGARRVSAQQVAHESGIEPGSSVFAVSGATARHRLDSTVAIRSSTVTSMLPGRVEIAVDEWQPVAVYTPRQGAAVYLDERGQILGPASGVTAGLPQIQGPPSDTTSGKRVIDPGLLTPLVNLARGLPDLVGQNVVAFRLDRCWNLVMVAGRGWRAIFGRMLTPDDYASLQPKVTALAALRSRVAFTDSTLYVNVMNPSAPAVGHGPDQLPVAAPTPAPSPSPSRSPPPSGSPSRAPSPSPPASSSPSPAPSPSAAPGAQCA